MSKRFLIIDGNSLLFRAYYATAYAGTDNIMRTKSGIPTNAVFAFSNMIVSILNTLGKDDSIFVAFDTGHKTFRHHEYEDYKATRSAPPEELITQFPIAREFLDALSISHNEIIGYEADDLAGTLAKKAAASGYSVELYSSDHDYLQLIDTNIVVKLIKKGLNNMLTLDKETLFKEFGFYPEQVSDFKGLTGDASDNLKGIPGVGKVTATKLLAEYGSLENILANADSIKGKLGENIREHQQLAITSKHLATILLDVPLDDNIEQYSYHGCNIALASAFAQKYELRQLINKIKIISTTTTENIPLVVGNNIEIDFSYINKMSFYIINDDDNYLNIESFKICLKIKDKVFEFTDDELFKNKGLRNLFTNPNIVKYTYDFKRAAIILNKHKIELSPPFEDILLTRYLIDSNTTPSLNSLLNTLGLSGEDSISHLVNNLETTIFDDILTIQKFGLKDVYVTIEKPLTRVLIKMEIQGFSVNKGILETIGDEYRSILEDLTGKIYTLVGHEFNINSPQQVASVLFDELQLPTNKKRSTAVDILKFLFDKHPVVPVLLEYRKYQKIISTYLEGLIPHIHSDGKVHSSFNQALTTTGRLSSNNPNLQNISVRNEEGRQVRKAFYEKGLSILSIDYSQIELRLLACIADVPSLIQIFNEDRDIHEETASRLFPLEDPDYARRKAKAVNFGIVYGISDFGLSEQLDISVAEARLIIQSFYEAYPEINNYRQQLLNELREKQYVTTITGRRRDLPQINDANYQIREFAKRAAMNAPIQGSAADLIKIAMIKVDEYLTTNKCQSKLLLQVHDELIFSLASDEEYIIEPIKLIMETVFDLPVKLKVGVSVGQTWFEAS